MILWAIVILIIVFNMDPWMGVLAVIGAILQGMADDGWTWKDVKNIPRDIGKFMSLFLDDKNKPKKNY